MAEGYTIAEAAELLGVPQRRVLQLIERGVLRAGLDERQRWRVHLGSVDVAPADPRVAGGGASDGARRDPDRTQTANDAHAASGAAGEGAVSDESRSNFRDLLAELRHLQERYGQALLALGEARGETAALRARLGDLQSARDVRLAPEAGRAAPWPEPAPVRPREEVAEPPPASVGPAGVRDDPPRRPEPASRPGRFGAAGVSEAMARAKDPATFALPGAREAAEALAELQRSDASPAAMPGPPGVVATAPAAPPRPPATRTAVQIHEPDDLRAAVGLRGTPAVAVERPLDRPLERLRRWLSG